MKKAVSLNDLPRFDATVRTLVSGGSLPRRVKNTKEVLREYDVEKWGRLLRELERKGEGFRFATLDRLESKSLGNCVSVQGDKLYLESHSSALRRFRKLVAAELRALMPASALVEVGAGYGGVFFPTARIVGSMPALVALEFTKSGRELLSRVAEAEQLPVMVGAADLGAQRVTEIAIPAGAVIFTCFAAPYVPVLSSQMIQSLCALRPKVVVHFEPLLHPEHQTTMLGILRRRYREANDYNQNLLDVLNEAVSEGSIRIRKLEPNWFGLNPLLPASLVVWDPC